LSGYVAGWEPASGQGGDWCLGPVNGCPSCRESDGRGGWKNDYRKRWENRWQDCWASGWRNCWASGWLSCWWSGRICVAWGWLGRGLVGCPCVWGLVRAWAAVRVPHRLVAGRWRRVRRRRARWTPGLGMEWWGRGRERWGSEWAVCGGWAGEGGRLGSLEARWWSADLWVVDRLEAGSAVRLLAAPLAMRPPGAASKARPSAVGLLRGASKARPTAVGLLRVGSGVRPPAVGRCRSRG